MGKGGASSSTHSAYSTEISQLASPETSAGHVTSTSAPVSLHFGMSLPSFSVPDECNGSQEFRRLTRSQTRSKLSSHEEEPGEPMMVENESQLRQRTSKAYLKGSKPKDTGTNFDVYVKM